MIDDLLQNEYVRRIAPPLAAALLILLFVSLGLWQLDRAGEKSALQESFATAADYVPLSEISGMEPYEPFLATGRFLDDRHILIVNVVMNERLGYYVVAPFDHGASEPLLLVNKGWIQKPTGVTDIPVADVESASATVRGRVGRLPRVGVRAGAAFADNGEWPKTAVFPTAEEISAQLNREVLPFIMLLDPDIEGGYLRDWRPREMGPMQHLGYAVQWFAFALIVFVVFAWRLRRKRRR